MDAHVKLRWTTLDLALAQSVVDPGSGAVSVFIGTTRDNFQGKEVLRLEYEAYEPMAVKQIHRVIAKARELFPDVRGVAVEHRLGVVPVTEASIIICVSS